MSSIYDISWYTIQSFLFDWLRHLEDVGIFFLPWGLRFKDLKRFWRTTHTGWLMEAPTGPTGESILSNFRPSGTCCFLKSEEALRQDARSNDQLIAYSTYHANRVYLFEWHVEPQLQTATRKGWTVIGRPGRRALYLLGLAAATKNKDNFECSTYS